MQVAETYCVRPLLSPSFDGDSSGLEEHELSLWFPGIVVADQNWKQKKFPHKKERKIQKHIAVLIVCCISNKNLIYCFVVKQLHGINVYKWKPQKFN